MVHDDGLVGLDGVRVRFDDERVVSDAGLMLAATLAGRLGIEGLVGRFVRLRRDRPGASSAGRKVVALIYAMALGAEGIDDCDVLHAGRTRRLLGGWVPAPSTLGTFLRAFTFGHVRQLDRVLAVALTHAWQAGAGPGDGRLVVDIDSFVGDAYDNALAESFVDSFKPSSSPTASGARDRNSSSPSSSTSPGSTTTGCTSRSAICHPSNSKPSTLRRPGDQPPT